MSSVWEQRFPGSVFLRNTKVVVGSLQKRKSWQLRNWAGWDFRLQRLRRGSCKWLEFPIWQWAITSYYNCGWKSQVKSVTPKGKKGLGECVETESAQERQTLSDRTLRLKSLVPILSDGTNSKFISV